MAAILVALVLIALDRLVKVYVVTNLAVGETMSLIPGVLQLTYVRNTGMSFSLLQDQQWILMVLIPLVLTVLIVLMVRGVFKGPVQRWAMVCVIAGAAGNLLDRIIYGHVVDMFDTVFRRSPIFNLADCFIVVGGIVFVISYLRTERRAERREAEKPAGGSDASETGEQTDDD